MATPLTIFGSDCVLWCAADLACLIGTTPKASGTTPPAVTWGTNLTRTDVPCIVCDGTGTQLTATFKWSLDGGATFQNTGLSAAATVTATTTAAAPIPTFPVGAYVLGARWDARSNKWTDQAATPHDFTNGTQTSHPLLLNNFKNGIRGLQWNGSTSQLTTALALPKPSTQQAYIFGVVRQDAGNAGGLYGMSNGTTGWSLRRAGASPAIGVDGLVGGTNSALAINAVGMIEVGVIAGVGYLRCFSTQSGATAADTALVASTLTLGFASGSGFGAVTWGEIGIVQRAATRSERDQVVTYLGNKWGFDVTGVRSTQAASTTNTQTPSVNRSFSIPGVSQAQLATALKSINMIRAASEAQAPSVVRSGATKKSAAQIQTSALGRTRPSLASAQAQVAALLRTLATEKDATQTQTPTATKSSNTSKTTTQSQTASFTKQASQHAFETIQNQTAAFLRVLGLNREINTAQTQTPLISNAYFRIFNTAQDQVAFLGRAIFVSIAEQVQTQTAQVLTLKTRIYTAVNNQTASVRRTSHSLGALYADLKVLVRPFATSVAVAVERKIFTDLRALVRPIITSIKTRPKR